jgi:hypothetical protein
VSLTPGQDILGVRTLQGGVPTLGRWWTAPGLDAAPTVAVQLRTVTAVTARHRTYAHAPTQHKLPSLRSCSFLLTGIIYRSRGHSPRSYSPPHAHAHAHAHTHYPINYIENGTRTREIQMLLALRKNVSLNDPLSFSCFATKLTVIEALRCKYCDEYVMIGTHVSALLKD